MPRTKPWSSVLPEDDSTPPADAARIHIPPDYTPSADGQGSAVRYLIATSVGLETDAPPYVERPDLSLPPCDGSSPP